jgi:hypothetical protein
MNFGHNALVAEKVFVQDVACLKAKQKNGRRKKMSEWLTTGEMIDRLKPGEIAIDDRGNVVKYIRGQLCWEGGDLFYVNIDQKVLGKWRILPRCVNFERAMKALWEGKKVRLYIDDEIHTFKDYENGQFWHCVGEMCGRIDFVNMRYIKEGKWTIEE